MKFTVYDLSVEEEVGLVWYRTKRKRWEAWSFKADVRPVMDALASVLGTLPKPLNAPDYP